MVERSPRRPSRARPALCRSMISGAAILFFSAVVGCLLALSGCGEDEPADLPWTGPETQVWHFQDTAPGLLPAGFRGVTGAWSVAAPQGRGPAGTARPRYLHVQPSGTLDAFSLLVVDGETRDDLHLSVRMMCLLPAEIGRGGGLVWRSRGGRDHYLAWFNPVERTVGIYSVLNGRRTKLATAEVPAGPGWHELQVTAAGDRAACWFDGRKVIETTDRSLPVSGGIGLWADGRAHVFFDDLRVRSAE